MYGDSVDVAKFQAAPRTPAQQIADRQKELAARSAEFRAEQEAADNAYLKYAVTKKQQGEHRGLTARASEEGRLTRRVWCCRPAQRQMACCWFPPLTPTS